MTPLPPPLGGSEFVAWRLDQAKFAATWDSGEGARRVGGRWNSRGIRAVYCCLDPATAILEVAVHKGFRALDIVPHVLTALTIVEPATVHVVVPASVPNPELAAARHPRCRPTGLRRCLAGAARRRADAERGLDP